MYKRIILSIFCILTLFFSGGTLASKSIVKDQEKAYKDEMSLLKVKSDELLARGYTIDWNDIEAVKQLDKETKDLSKKAEELRQKYNIKPNPLNAVYYTKESLLQRVNQSIADYTQFIKDIETGKTSYGKETDSKNLVKYKNVKQNYETFLEKVNNPNETDLEKLSNEYSELLAKQRQ